MQKLKTLFLNLKNGTISFLKAHQWYFLLMAGLFFVLKYKDLLYEYYVNSSNRSQNKTLDKDKILADQETASKATTADLKKNIDKLDQENKVPVDADWYKNEK